MSRHLLLLLTYSWCSVTTSTVAQNKSAAIGQHSVILSERQPQAEDAFVRRYRSCTVGLVTNAAWMVGTWLWVEKHRDGCLLAGGDFESDRLCVFPYMDYTRPIPVDDDLAIAAEFSTWDPNGNMVLIESAVRISTNIIAAGGPSGWRWEYSHVTDGNHDYMILTAGPSSLGCFRRTVLLKISDDPGKPLHLKDVWLDRFFPRWREYEEAHQRRLPRVEGTYVVNYPGVTGKLQLFKDGRYRQMLVWTNSTLSVTNCGRWKGDRKSIWLERAVALQQTASENANQVMKDNVWLDIVRFIRGNVLQNYRGYPEYRQVRSSDSP
jgi:hypothetical protein